LTSADKLQNVMNVLTYLVDLILNEKY
jgi:hypothetical protein